MDGILLVLRSYSLLVPTLRRTASRKILGAVVLVGVLAIGMPASNLLGFTAAVDSSAAQALGRVVDTGNRFFCAVNSSGGVECWFNNSSGSNSFGELGQGDTSPRTGRVVVNGLASGVAQITLGNTHACAVLEANGAVSCWGGINTGSGLVAQSTPQTVLRTSDSQPLTGVVDISSFRDLTCAVAGGGSVWCWGYALTAFGYWEPSAPGRNYQAKAYQVVASGASGVTVGNSFACALLNDATVKCWGQGGSGQIGAASATQYDNGPTTVTGLSGVVAVSAGQEAACALLTTGAVRCWGSNLFGLSDPSVAPGSANNQPTPGTAIALPLGAGENVVAIGTDYALALALTDAGKVYRWGGSSSNQASNAPRDLGRSGITGMAVGDSSSQPCYVGTGFTLDCDQTGDPAISLLLPPPGTPTIATATAGSTQATITVSPGAGGSPTSYLVTAQPSGRTCTVTAPAVSCTVTGLTDGVAQTFSATASNSQGTSGASTGVAITPGPAATPAAPHVVAGVGQLTITLQAGSGGGTATSYEHHVEPGGHSCALTPPSTACTITGLIDATMYSVTTTAINDAGSSPPSAVVTISAGAPHVPLAPSVTVGDGSATVQIQPAATGGTPASYTVTAQPGAHTCTVTPPAASCALSGLTNGTDYTFTTTATNNGGTTVASPGLVALVDILPLAPPAPHIEIGGSEVTVSVQAAPTGGIPQSFVVTAQPDAHTCTVIPPATSCAISGLTPDTDYDFTTVAVNGIGTSSASPVRSAPYSLPAPPSIERPTIASGQMTVTISAGAGGGPAITYVTYAEPGGHSCTVTPPANACTLTGLTDDIVYTVTSSAINGLGTVASTEQIVLELDRVDPPAALSISDVSSGTVTVSVNPATTGGMPAFFTATAQPGGRSCVIVAPATTCAITGLSDGTGYTITTSATNGFGTVTSSALAIVTVAAVAPPLEPLVEPMIDGVTLRINPATTGGSAMRFDLFVQPGDHTCAVVPPATSCDLMGLTEGVVYTVTTSATNGFGTVTSSAATLFSPLRRPEIPPPPPMNSGPEIDPPATSTPVTPSSPETAPAPIPLDPASGRLPELAPGASMVSDDGRLITVLTEIVGPSELRMHSSDFMLSIEAECVVTCPMEVSPDGTPIIRLDSNGRVRIAGVGFLPGSGVHVWMMSEPRAIGTVTVTPQGTFEASLPLPDLEVGAHTLQVNGMSANQSLRSANIGVIVEDAMAPLPAVVELPASGTRLQTMAMVALLSMALGAFVLRRGRRMNGSTTAPLAP